MKSMTHGTRALGIALAGIALGTAALSARAFEISDVEVTDYADGEYVDVTFDGSTNYTYAFKGAADLLADDWSTITNGIGGTGSNQTQRLTFGTNSGYYAQGAVRILRSDDAWSDNAVGWRRDTIPDDGDYILMGVQHEGFDATLLGMFGTNRLTAGAFPQQADQLDIYDTSTSGYDTYGLKSSDMEFHDTSDWFGDSVNPDLPEGTGLWAHAPTNVSAHDVVLAGEVVGAATQSMDIVGGYQLISYPFSCGVGINDLEFAYVGATAGLFPQSADQISVWNGTGYDIYGLKSPDSKWYDVNSWFTGSPTSNSIPQGAGFWYEARDTNGFTWTEANPYSDMVD